MFQSEKYLSAVKHFPFSLSLSFLYILHLGARGGEWLSLHRYFKPFGREYVEKEIINIIYEST